MLGLVTVIDKRYFLGGLVMIYSFVKNNPWFKGDIIIIADDLPKYMKEALSLFPNVRWTGIDSELKDRLTLFNRVSPEYTSSPQKFNKLMAFGFTEYEKLLFLDADVLCCGDLSDLFSMRIAGLHACPDRSYYLNKKRERYTFLACNQEEQKAGLEYIECFNSGVMLINFGHLTKNTLTDLFSMISPIKFSTVKTGHCDQYILNLFFNKRYFKISSIYNYLLHCQEEVFSKEGLTFNDAKIIHFVKNPKPWNKSPIEKGSSLEMWYSAYLECLNWMKTVSEVIYKKIMPS